MTVECPSCHLGVPRGSFCGLCGQPLTTPVVTALRLGNFGACPDEAVLRPALASSLFPHLPRRSRLPFRVGLLAIGLGLVGFAGLRFNPGLVALIALGPTLLFLLYLRASRVYRGLPRGSMILAVGLGVGLAVCWTVLTNPAEGWDLFAGLFRGWSISGDYDVPLPVQGRGVMDSAGMAALAGTLMMSVPAVVARLLRARAREALDGFAVGAMGALAFSGAASLIRLAPQLTTGVQQFNRPFSSFAVEAAINGVVVPLSAAATGGVVGLALWFTPRRDHRVKARRVLWLLFGAVLAAGVGIGLVDSAQLPQAAVLLLDLLLMLVCLLTLRLGIQVGLLHEEPDSVTGEPLLCEHCERVAPVAAFCAACGVASRASSKESRRLRREMPPVAVPG